MEMQQVIPEGFDFAQTFKEGVREAFAPVARLEMLRHKPYLNAREVAELYGIPVKSLSTWRCRGGGPEYKQPYKNGPVFYEHEQIIKFQNRCSVRVHGA